MYILMLVYMYVCMLFVQNTHKSSGAHFEDPQQLKRVLEQNAKIECGVQNRRLPAKNDRLRPQK